MQKIKRNIFALLGNGLVLCAIQLIAISVNTTCACFAYQSVIPESAKKLRKF